jgi:hypothetical protein
MAIPAATIDDDKPRFSFIPYSTLLLIQPAWPHQGI